MPKQDEDPRYTDPNHPYSGSGNRYQNRYCHRFCGVVAVGNRLSHTEPCHAQWAVGWL